MNRPVRFVTFSLWHLEAFRCFTVWMVDVAPAPVSAFFAEQTPFLYAMRDLFRESGDHENFLRVSRHIHEVETR